MIRGLARQLTDGGIAQTLNRLGKRTGRGNAWTEARVRDQLKVLAIEKQTTVHKLVCQALNDLFAAEHRPEIAR